MRQSSHAGCVNTSTTPDSLGGAEHLGWPRGRRFESDLGGYTKGNCMKKEITKWIAVYYAFDVYIGESDAYPDTGSMADQAEELHQWA